MTISGTGNIRFLGADSRSLEKRPKLTKMPARRRGKDMMSPPPKLKRKK